jgi:cyanate permease
VENVQIQEKELNYRWVILALGALTGTIVCAIPSMAMPVLFKEISDDLGLSLVQIGVIWGIASLAGIFSSLIGGTLGDRYGTKRILMIACVLAGATGALRGLSKDFSMLGITVLLNGLIYLVIPTNVTKACSMWFSRKQLGLATGVTGMGMAIGFVIGSLISATVISPAIGGWRNVLVLYGALGILIGVIWTFTRNAPEDFQSSQNDAVVLSPRQAFLKVARIKRVWFLGLVLMGVSGCIKGTLGYLPLYLREIGWTASSADGALASFHAVSTLFVVPLAFLSDRLGKRKPILITAAFVTTIGVGSLYFAQGNIIWPIVMMTGLFRDGFIAVFFATVMESRSVGKYLSGTAVGLTLVLSSVAGLLSPPIGNSMAKINPSFPFLFWAGLALVSTLGFIWLKDDKGEDG